MQAKSNKDRRVEWLSYKNIIDWTTRAKAFLIDIGMAKDEPGIICESTCTIIIIIIIISHAMLLILVGVESEISLIHPPR